MVVWWESCHWYISFVCLGLKRVFGVLEGVLHLFFGSHTWEATNFIIMKALAMISNESVQGEINVNSQLMKTPQKI